MATLQSLAYETSLAALRAQEEELNRLRTHTGTLLAAGSLAASFLGAQTLSRPGTGPWSTLAIVAFVLSILPCVYLLVPKRGLVFSLSGPVLYEEFSETGQTLDDVHAAVAVWLQTYHEANQKKIDSLNRYFVAASGALVAEIVLFALALQATI